MLFCDWAGKREGEERWVDKGTRVIKGTRGEGLGPGSLLQGLLFGTLFFDDFGPGRCLDYVRLV